MIREPLTILLAKGVSAVILNHCSLYYLLNQEIPIRNENFRQLKYCMARLVTTQNRQVLNERALRALVRHPIWAAHSRARWVLADLGWTAWAVLFLFPGKIPL